MNINYQILDYDKILEELRKLENGNEHTKVPVKKVLDMKPTRLGYDVPHYTIGHGDTHIVIVASTHGSEIISCDFVLKLMEAISEKKNGFEDFNPDEITIDFLPLHNPEGFIISTSAIKTLIKDDMTDKEKEAICKKYYSVYRQDDIKAKEKPNDHTTLKGHQAMFQDATYECIPEKHKLLRESVRQIYETHKHPVGSMIMWRANGSGVELNRNHPLNTNEISYGGARYNNILSNVPGPIGTTSFTTDKFSYEPENENLFKLVDTLVKEGKYAGLLTYHSTMGRTYAKPTYTADESILPDDKRYQIEAINAILAKEYEKYTGYKVMEAPDIEAVDELLRVLYPGVILIELSEMGGNPLGPYGDILGNYTKVMTTNMKATSAMIELLPRLKPFINEQQLLIITEEQQKKL